MPTTATPARRPTTSPTRSTAATARPSTLSVTCMDDRRSRSTTPTPCPRTRRDGGQRARQRHRHRRRPEDDRLGHAAGRRHRGHRRRRLGPHLQPDANYCNAGPPTDDFTYTLNGGDSATVAMKRDLHRRPPVAVDDADTVLEDTFATTVDVLANDTDIDGGTDDDRLGHAAGQRHRVITGGGTGLTYEPDANYCNAGPPTDDFTYTLNGGDSATVRERDLRRRRAGRGRRLRHRARGLGREPRSTCSPTTPTSTAAPSRCLGHAAGQRHRGHHRRRHRPHLRARTPTTATAARRPTTSPTRSTAARRATVAMSVTCVDDAAGRGRRHRRPCSRTRARPRSTCWPTTPTSTAAPVDRLGHAAGQRHRGHHRRRRRPHLRARRQLLQRRPADRRLHLHAQRRLDARRSRDVTCVDDAAGRGRRRRHRGEDSRATPIDVLGQRHRYRRRPDVDRLGHPAGQRHRGRSPAAAPASPTSRTPTTATPARRPTTSPTRSTAARQRDGRMTVTCVDDAAGRGRRRRRPCSRTPARPRRRARPTTPTSTAARVDRLGHAAGQRHRGHHRRRHGPHLRARRQLLQRRHADRQLHLHAQRRLDARPSR